MDKQTYAQRVQGLAEEKAQDQRNIYYSVYLKAKNHYPNEGSKWSNQFHIQNWEKVIVPRYIANARIAVAEAAQAVRAAIEDAYGIEGCNNYLKEQGLIPDNAQEGGQNGQDKN